MKIAQVAPLIESVPPKAYGGTERVVSYLTEALVLAGHEVTLFASGDSETAARLVSVTDRALRLDPDCHDPMAHHVRQLDRVACRSGEFDVIHFHTDYMHFPLMRQLRSPHVTTLHGRLDIRDLAPVFQEFDDMPVVSISDHQRTPLPFANWQATVYNGLPRDLYPFNPQPGNYFAFLGRISPEKRVDRAIEIATRLETELLIAAKVDKVDQEYFDEVIKPLLRHPLVHYLGEISDHEKGAFLGNARGLLFPIDWPEPFGLVMIEAMACGTPVVAYRRGSVPEVMRDGETGFVVDDQESAIGAAARLESISRLRCRQVFEAHFSAERMAEGYLQVYQNLEQRDPVPRLVVS